MPGFINFKLKKYYLYENLNNVLTLKSNYGRQSFGNNEKVNIEFVSANPTGILHMGNARGGVILLLELCLSVDMMLQKNII